jgi:hypothetical protein
VKEPTDHKAAPGTEPAKGKDDAAKKEEAARKEADAGAAIDAQLRKAREVTFFTPPFEIETCRPLVCSLVTRNQRQFISRDMTDSKAIHLASSSTVRFSCRLEILRCRLISSSLVSSRVRSDDRF